MTSTDDYTRFPLRIGEFAADLQLNPKTIRCYEAIGLLPAPRRNLGFPYHAVKLPTCTRSSKRDSRQMETCR
jgi:hypothetical protein